MSMHNLAISYDHAGRILDALKLREETLQLRKAKLAPDHPSTLTSMTNLANSYDSIGRTQDALTLREETIQLMKAKLGPDHPDTLISMNNLANSYEAAGRKQDALKLREETIQLMKAKLGPDHPDTLRNMNNLAISYIRLRRTSEALALVRQTLALRQQRVNADPNNIGEQSFLAFTYGQLGEAEQTEFNFAAAVRAFARSVELFNHLDQAKSQTPFWHGQFADVRARLELCRKAEQAVRDLDFALEQPAAEVPGLLDLRVQALAAKKDEPGLAATAAAYSRLAATDAGQCYNAACAWSLLYGLASSPGADAAKHAEEYAGIALALLKQTPTGKDQVVATPAALAAHMKQDNDLDPLRQRDDFKKLLAELEAKTPPKTATEGKR
jgi:tetratricopeptide (TPR) repeat protein